MNGLRSGCWAVAADEWLLRRGRCRSRGAVTPRRGFLRRRPGVELGGDPAPRMTSIRSAASSALADLGGREQDGDALCGLLGHQRKMSAFAPTSMPRVGSSRRSTAGSVSSILPMTTFCWLPPDSEPIARPAGGLDPDVLHGHGAASVARRKSRRQEARSRERDVVADRHRLDQPVALPVLRHEGQPALDPIADGRLGDVLAVRGRCRRGSRPARVSSSSVRPAPIRP